MTVSEVLTRKTINSFMWLSNLHENDCHLYRSSSLFYHHLLILVILWYAIKKEAHSVNLFLQKIPKKVELAISKVIQITEILLWVKAPWWYMSQRWSCSLAISSFSPFADPCISIWTDQRAFLLYVRCFLWAFLRCTLTHRYRTILGW